MKRGRGNSKYIAYGGNGVATDEDQWCARFRPRDTEGGE